MGLKIKNKSSKDKEDLIIDINWGVWIKNNIK
jgi:hypothetical protein